MQRTGGTGRLGVRVVDRVTRLATLYQEGACKIRMPSPQSSRALDAVLINTAGGLTGGDCLDWDIHVAENASAVVTTQACERYYRSIGGVARVNASIRVEPGATLCWLPQETIIFDRASLSRTIDVELDSTSSYLMVEPMIFGRKAMGETVRQAHIADRWRIRRDGRLIHAEDLRLSGDIAALLRRANVADGAIALATIVLVSAECGDILEKLRLLAGARAGASHVRAAAGDKIVVRMVADSGLELRRQLAPILELLTATVIGPGHGLPKFWNL